MTKFSIRTSESQTATIYLGAASTITAGLSTYFKSRNQPNRARQFRQALKAVRNRMDDQSRDLVGLTPEQARDAARKIIKQYNDALAEDAANYPDFWVTLGHSHKELPGNSPEQGTLAGDDQPETHQLNGRRKPDKHSTKPPSSPTKPPIQHGSQTGSFETHAKLGDSFAQSNFTTSHTQALASAPRPNPETPANHELKPFQGQIDIDKNPSPLEERPLEKSDRNAAAAAAE
jgi:hypothetical protein